MIFEMDDKLKRVLKGTSFEQKEGNTLFSTGCKEMLDKRIQKEDLSVRLYLAMSIWLNDNEYLGAAKLWKKYSSEERNHADWSRDYILAMGMLPTTDQLEKPQNTFSSFVDIINQSYDHEVDLTKECNELCSYAMQKGNHMLYTLGLQYVKEQIEELGKIQNWKDRLSAFGTDKVALRLLDNEMMKYK